MPAAQAVELPELPPRYRVVAVLGEGGMGRVLEVEDRGGEPRRKALKIVASDQAFLVRSLRDEFKFLTRLRHPNLARVHDFGILPGGAAFFTVELVEGPRLDGRGAIASPAEALRIARELLDVLGFLHARGYLHNDVKPSNVMLDGHGPGARVRLLDLGLAGLRHSSEAPMVGTLPYMPPERLRGLPPDPRSDLYSLGATLYRVLAGEHPRRGDTAAELLAAPPPAPLARLRPDLPEALADLVMRLLEPDPARRPASAFSCLRGHGLPPSDEAAREVWAFPPVVLGRESEQKALEEAARACRSGECRLCLVTGPLGSGRTRLLDEVLHRRQLEGFAAARVPGSNVAGPFGTLRALAAALGATPPDPPGGTRDPAEASRAAASSFADVLLGAAGSRPLAALFDDADAADAPSLEALGPLLAAARRNRAPLLVVLAATGPVPALAPALDLAREAGALACVQLDVLDEDRLGQMLDGMFAGGLPSAARRQLTAMAGGSPLLAVELARAFLDAEALRLEGGSFVFDAARREAALGSARLADLAHARLASLSPDARRLVDALAVLRRPCASELLCEVAGGGQLADEILLLCGQGLVRRDGDLVSLPNEALAGAALAGLDVDRRRVLHGRAAEALDRADEEPEERATHRFAAGDAAGAAPLALRAVVRARDAGDLRRAESLLAQIRERVGPGSLARAEQAQFYEVEGDLAAAGARADQAIDRYRSALDLCGPGEAAARVAARAADAARLGGRWSDAEAFLLEARAAGSPRGLAFIAAARARLLVETGHQAAASSAVADGLAALESADPSARETLHLRRALELRRGLLAHIAGALGEAEQASRRAAQTALAIGDRHAEAQALMNLGSVLRDRGLLGSAIEVLDRALDINTRYGHQAAAFNVQMMLALVWAEMGEVERAWSQAQACLAQGGGPAGWALLVAAQVAAACERPEAADLLERTLAFADDQGAEIVSGEYAKVYAPLAPAARLPALRQRAEHAAARTGSPYLATFPDQIRAYELSAAGDPAGGARLLHVAADVISLLGFRCDEARVRLAEAEMSTAAGRPADARAAALQAYLLWAAIGAPRFAARAAAMAGLAPPLPDPSRLPRDPIAAFLLAASPEAVGEALLDAIAPGGPSAALAVRGPVTILLAVRGATPDGAARPVTAQSRDPGDGGQQVVLVAPDLSAARRADALALCNIAAIALARIEALTELGQVRAALGRLLAERDPGAGEITAPLR